MGIDLIKALEQGIVVDEHGHVLSGTAKLLYLMHCPIRSIQEWRLKPEKHLSRNACAHKQTHEGGKCQQQSPP